MTTSTHLPPLAEGGIPPASCTWHDGVEGWQLALGGDWRGAVIRKPDPPPRGVFEVARPVVVEGSGITATDADTAAALWRVLAPLAHRGVALELRALPLGLEAELGLALAAAKEALPTRADDAHASNLAVAAAARANAFRHGWRALALFVGDATLALVHLVRGQATLRGTGLVALFDQAGPRCLPIVMLTTALIGLMLAYMGGAQLGRIGAESYIANVVTVGMVREVAGLMTGIVLAGRVGAAFAAQLGTMQANEEVDALRTLGVRPTEHLVVPRLIAMLVMAPPLIAVGMLCGTLAGAPAAVWAYGVPLPEYLHQCLRALTWNHLWIGLFKGTLYAALVAIAGCQEGLRAGRNAEAVGEATTRAVVKSLVWIVAAASLSTVVLQSLGF